MGWEETCECSIILQEVVVNGDKYHIVDSLNSLVTCEGPEILSFQRASHVDEGKNERDQVDVWCFPNR